MNLRKQLELLRDLVALSAEHKAQALALDRMVRRLARVWDAEDRRREARTPALPFDQVDEAPAEELQP